MVKLFIQGEPLYMGLLTALLFVILFLGTYPIHHLSFKLKHIVSNESRMKRIKSVGLLSVVFGVFTQFLGLYGALQTIEVWGEVEAEVLFKGIQISFIPMCYGIIIYSISRVFTYPRLSKKHTLS